MNNYTLRISLREANDIREALAEFQALLARRIQSASEGDMPATREQHRRVQKLIHSL